MRLGESAGRGWTWRALGCGAAAVLAMYLASLLLASMIGPLRALGQSMSCQANLHNLSRGFAVYAEDYDRRLPPSAAWMSRLASHVDGERRFHCPTVSRAGDRRFGYAMNTAVSARERTTIAEPDRTPVVYDSTDLAQNAADAVSSLPTPGRHVTRPRKGAPPRRVNFAGYVDGSARIVVDAPR